ncbi:MAG: hypothetical protein CVU22_07045 [Betaproteobacteria bacterium HGW-Betaproteobacteria-16]|nr:MAG: hypothetical protein CVU22_07045 [Betaproteobacteria bacterium HGW-Betaproteobacteria-16]
MPTIRSNVRTQEMKTRLTVVLLCAIAGAAFTSPTWAINKCSQPNGSFVFQDAPCAGKGEKLDVRPATGHVRPAEPVTATNGDPAAPKRQTEAQRIEQMVAISQLERRLKDATAAIHSTRERCAQEIKSLQLKKQYATNNLAGATWESSISSEMSALATSCDTRNRELREDATALRAECRELGGCK